ncbi:MAG: hypothetical protein AMR96_02785 [Candidatus Adiutrix intracellularis]|nr:MAG: hypothetical protein AMR96_02785 [Candidatus Adiutrix intracellularis]
MAWGMIGLDRVVTVLRTLIEFGRLPHAILLTGLAGGGKNSLARALTAALNCSNPVDDCGPCGCCPSCLKIAGDIYPDLTTLAPIGRARNISIDEVRSLRQAMAFRPFEARTKVFIIREADRLGLDAGQALLKTLEEPPPDSVLILTTASEAAIPDTIRSRCFTVKVPPLPMEMISATLAGQHGMIGPEARLLAALSGGALGRALALESADTWDSWQWLNRIMGAGETPVRLTLAWEWIDKISIKKDDFTTILNLLRFWWRETIRLAVSGLEALEGPGPDPAQSCWAARLNSGVIGRIMAALARLEDSLGRSVNPELAFGNYWLTIFKSD